MAGTTNGVSFTVIFEVKTQDPETAKDTILDMLDNISAGGMCERAYMISEKTEPVYIDEDGQCWPSKEEAEEPDDDPQCTNCGAYRSEHGVNGPCDGFTTQPGGFVVYTSSDLAEMSYDELDELYGRGRDYDEEEG